MGSSASKAAKTAAGMATRRQYPTRIPPTSNPAAQNPPTATPAPGSQPGPTVHPSPHASESKVEAVSLDARDPDYAASLRSLGPVQPNPTLSNTSTFSSSPSNTPIRPPGNDPSPPQGANIFPSAAQNPALEILTAKERIAEEAEREFSSARRGVDTQRRFLDIGAIRQVLDMRDQKRMRPEQIEKEMGLGNGVVARLAAVKEARVGRKSAEDAGIYG